MKQELLYERKNHVIMNLTTEKKEHFDSINLAKKQSAILQRSNGGLGMGSLVVVK